MELETCMILFCMLIIKQNISKEIGGFKREFKRTLIGWIQNCLTQQSNGTTVRVKLISGSSKYALFCIAICALPWRDVNVRCSCLRAIINRLWCNINLWGYVITNHRKWNINEIVIFFSNFNTTFFCKFLIITIWKLYTWQPLSLPFKIHMTWPDLILFVILSPSVRLKSCYCTGLQCSA